MLIESFHHGKEAGFIHENADGYTFSIETTGIYVTVFPADDGHIRVGIQFPTLDGIQNLAAIAHDMTEAMGEYVVSAIEREDA
jgi:uncharacterized protein (UPF0254 family)